MPAPDWLGVQLRYMPEQDCRRPSSDSNIFKVRSPNCATSNMLALVNRRTNGKFNHYPLATVVEPAKVGVGGPVGQVEA